MKVKSTEELLHRIEELENRLQDSEQLIEAIKAGEVDAFAVGSKDQQEIYTLQTVDHAYRVLIEKFSEGAVNLTDDGLIVYTNTYFFELLNLSYEKVVGRYFTDFVDEGSKDTFDMLFKQSLNGGSKGEINLCIDKRIIPVYISLTSLQPKLDTVGIIITDLTEKKKNEEIILKYQYDLEIKNLELLRSNTELASFTYVASHDLQEPLRKIQTFANRILDKDDKSLTEITGEYFQRIVAASYRMQNLINSLLSYSRTNTSEIALALTPLNTIVEDVRNNLSELIEENKATIEVGELPVLNIIPVQFTQLFSNIIMNAIKYRRRGVDPVIKITADVIELQNQSSANNKHWRISIADNGIGFEQQYADKIFELFQRLHGRTEYEGTGIGLAICKKIVQNHNGYIEAIGKPDVGATFNIYLPLK